MMYLNLFCITNLLISLAASSASYQGQKVLNCQIRNKEAAGLLEGIDIWYFDVKSNNVTLRVINNYELNLALSSGSCVILTDILTDSLPKTKNSVTRRSLPEDTRLAPNDFFSDYRSYETIGNSLQYWASKSDVATFIPSIGKTFEGRDIFAIKITNTESGSKKGIWINAGLHAREWIAPAAALYTINKLIEEANTTRVDRLLSTFEYHFTPLANPDGYEFSRIYGNRFWRKNRRDNGNGHYGVDLNRNWDEHWGYIDSSSDPSSENYQGPAAHSEPEVKALAQYALNIPNKYGGIDLHSFGQNILRNWGWTTKLSSNEKLLESLGLAIQQAFKFKSYNYTSQTSADLYPVGGTLGDWMTTKANLVSFIFELCPTADIYSSFHLSTNQIVNCSEGAYAGIIAYSEYLDSHSNIPPNSEVSL